MHIPVRIDYAVRALVDLAQHSDKGPVRANDIARRNVIPEPFLAQVLHSLNKKGIIRSQRGPHGGHELAMDPADIPLSMVMACLGGLGTVVGCLGNTEACIHIPSCSQREVWQSVDEAVFNILDATSIASLAQRARSMGANLTQNESPEPVGPVVV